MSSTEAYSMKSVCTNISSELIRPGDDIDRLALRISLADIDEQFEKVIHKSLVFILRYLAKYEDHRKKLMELLGDVTRRLKCRPSIQIPVHELFISYNDPGGSTYLTNFSHMYIRLGYPRMPINEQIRLLPVLYASLSENKPIVQRDVLLHLTLPIIGRVASETCNRRELELHDLPSQRRFISEFYSLVLLLPYRFERLIRFDNNDTNIPEGFNSYDYSRVAHDRFSSIHSAEDLEKFKVSIVYFYSRNFFPPDESIIPLLFANADTRHNVVSTAEREVHTLDRLIDWEDEYLLSRMFDWYLGRRREFDPKGRSEPRRPLSPHVRIKLGTYLLRSRQTLVGPLASDLIQAAILCLQAVAVTSRQSDLNKQPPPPPISNTACTTHGNISSFPTGEEQCHMDAVMQTTETVPAGTDTIRQNRCLSAAASLIQQRRLADHGLNLLAHLLDNAATIPAATSILALRGLINFVYEHTSDDFVPSRARGFELLSRFLSRDPNYLLKDPGQLPRLFDVLSEDIAPDLKTAAALCLRRLALTFQEAQRQNYPALRNQLVKLERLLYENMERSDPVSRLVAVHFAGVIYPLDHIPTRYLILQALGDKDPRVRAEARMAFSLFLDQNVASDIVYGRVKLPSFVEFVNHDTQHSRKNPFIDVERLIPVVQFIRLCLLAVKGGLTPTQEAGMLYETDDEIRYRINQNVRYLLSASKCDTALAANVDSSTVANQVESSIPQSQSTNSVPNPEQARRSIDTYFRLIHVVIFARSQTTRDSPEFPNFLEEVLVNNTNELISGGKPIFERMNSLLLATPRGANCRHACASVYSVVTMATETPSTSLQIAVNMISEVPKESIIIDAEMAHTVQGMMIGSAYLLKNLYDKYVSAPSASKPASTFINAEPGSGEVKSKRSKKQDSKNKSQLQAGINAAVNQFLETLDGFLIRPAALLDKPLGKESSKGGNDVDRYINTSVAQSSVTALLEALAVLSQAGCLSHLPAGTIPSSNSFGLIDGNSSPSCSSSKANLVLRVASYLNLPLLAPSSGSGSGNVSTESIIQLASHQRVWFASLRALACLCTGEPAVTGIASTVAVTSKNKKGFADTQSCFSSHPHLLYIIKTMSSLVEVRDPALHLAIGAAMADSLLGSASPYKGLWYERMYPLLVPPGASLEAAKSQAGQWLAERFAGLLKHQPGQVSPPASMVAAALWALAMVRRFGPPPPSLLPVDLFINLLTENDDSLQCIAASVLGLIYDRSDEESRITLVKNLTKVITNDKRSHILIFRELCNLAKQINRPDLALALVVLATTPLPPTINASAILQFPNYLEPNCNHTRASFSASPTPWLALCSVACAGLVRRLGRSLVSALPRLVPRIFIRRFDFSRPRLCHAMQMVWLGLILYATPSVAANTTASSTAAGSSVVSEECIQPNSSIASSLSTVAADLVETNFNAIFGEIKTQLGLSSAGTTVSSQTTGAGIPTNDVNLRDACCFGVVALTQHPSACKRLAGNLPALLSCLLNLVDEAANSEITPLAYASDPALVVTGGSCPAEKAAIAVQNLICKALEDPSCRDIATGLLPGILPILIDRALSTVTGNQGPGALLPSDSRRFALDLLLEAARIARPSAIRPAIPQLALAGLHTMASLSPARVVSVMTSSSSNSSAKLTPSISMSPTENIVCKEEQMAKVLRMCVRFMDEASLSRLIMPLTEFIRGGGGPVTASVGASSASGGARGVGSTSAAAVATATCIFISDLASSSSTLINSFDAELNSSTTVLPTSPKFDGSKGEETTERCLTSSSENSSCNEVSNGHTNINEVHKQQQTGLVLGGVSPSSTTTTVSTSIAARRRLPCSSQNFSQLCSVLQTAKTTTSASTTVSMLVPHTGKLLAALLCALPGAGLQADASNRKIVQEEMSRTVACLLGFAKDTSVAKVFSRVRSWFLETSGANDNSLSGNNSGQWACVRVMHEIASFCPELLFAHAGLTLPLVFINKQSESDILQISHHSGASASCDDLSFSLNLVSENRALTTTALNIQNDEDLEQRRALWKETWEKMLPKGSFPGVLNSHCQSYQHFYQQSDHNLFANIIGIPSSSPLIVPFPLTGLLKPPLLSAFVGSLSEALLKSPSWLVRNQAGLALLSVSAAIVSQPMLMLTTAASSLFRDVAALARSSPNGSLIPASGSAITDEITARMANASIATLEQRETHQEETLHPVNDDEDEEEDDDDDEEEDEDDDEEEDDDDDDDDDEEDEETVFLIWSELVRLLSSTLTQTGFWTGKIYLLRAARMLAQTALERGFAVEEANTEIIDQFWNVLVRETRCRNSDFAGPGYQAEAFLALANFSEACGRDATGLTGASCTPAAMTPGEPDLHLDRLTVLLRLIFPSGVSISTGNEEKGKNKRNNQAEISTELTETELELAVRAVGILWPMQPKIEHVDRFAETLSHLTCVMSHGGWKLHAAALSSILAVLVKLSPEQTSLLVNRIQQKEKVAEQLGLKDLMVRLKRAADNKKSEVLREHVLGAIASILRHPAFVDILRENLLHLLQSYSSGGTSNLREWSSALLKGL